MSVKQENEITVKILCDISTLEKLLINKGFKIVDKFVMNDIFMIPPYLNIENMATREVISKCILIRDIENLFKKTHNKNKKITYKIKDFDNDGSILNQIAIDCDILDIESAILLFEAIGYKRIMNIVESDIVYGKEGFEIAIKDIKNGDKLIEIEIVSDNPNLDTIEKLKEKLVALEIPIDTKDFFVKKAEIEFDKIRK